MKKILALLALSSFALASQATCVGSGSFQSCTDNSGNSYTVQRAGNSTFVHGSGPNGTWNQTSQTIGNTTFHNGQAVNGNAWSGSTQSIGNMQIHNGVNSNGQSYNRTCTPYGCY